MNVRHRTLAICLSLGLLTAPLVSWATVVDDQQALYQDNGAGPFNAQRGEQLWQREVVNRKDGRVRSCTTCHGAGRNDRRRGQEGLGAGVTHASLEVAVGGADTNLAGTE